MCELLILLILRTCPVSGEAMSSNLWIPACGVACMPKKPRLSLYDSWAQDWQVPLLYTYSLLLWYPIVRYVKSRMQWGVFLCNTSSTAAYSAIFCISNNRGVYYCTVKHAVIYFHWEYLSTLHWNHLIGWGFNCSGLTFDPSFLTLEFLC